MDKEDIKFVYKQTGARVFYYKERKSWCALWIENGEEHKLFFGKGLNVYAVITAITQKRLTQYTFNKESEAVR